MEAEDTLSVAEARALMPDTTANMSDTEVEKLVSKMEFLATALVKAVQFDSEFIVNIAYNRGEEAR